MLAVTKAAGHAACIISIRCLSRGYVEAGSSHGANHLLFFARIFLLPHACSYAKRVTQQLQALGARGVTFLFSSGDGGVAGSQPTSCNSGFIPTFPAASPYVTAVGATDNPANETAAGFRCVTATAVVVVLS